MSIAPALAGPSAALGHAFDRIRAAGSVADTDAAEHALMAALRPVIGSAWPEVAWRSGLLTATGYPTELAWASRDVAVRWTCEVAGPEVPEADRLGCAQRAVEALAGARIETAPWAVVQGGQTLRWGAWLGLRQAGGTRSAKIYLELPVGQIAPGPWSAVGSRLASRVPGLTWRMAGLNDDGSVELYARVPELTWASLADLAGDRGQLVDLIGELVRRPGSGPGFRRGDTILPRPSGLSLVLAPSGALTAVTWFAIAKSVWAGDAAVRAAVLRTMAGIDHQPGSRELYRALSSGPDDGRWRHGMVGAGVTRSGRIWLQAGLRPT